MVNSGVCEKSRGPGRPRDEDVRRRILDAAARLLEEAGFANATIEAIAEQAGTSKSTIYRWWPNKAAVLIEAFRESMAVLLPFARTGSLAEDIRQQVLQFAAVLRSRNGRRFAAVLAAAQTDPEIADAFRSMWLVPRRAEAKQALQRHQETGELRADVDLDIAIEILYAPLYYRLLTGFGELTPERVEELARTALEGLRPR